MLRYALAAAILSLPSRRDRELRRLKEQNRKLEERNWALEALARDYRDFLEADLASCTCEEGDPCPLCRCDAVLGREWR